MIRRAVPGDADFVASLLVHGDVEPFLSARRPRDRDAVLERIERSHTEPPRFGVFVIEETGRPAGVMEFEEGNRRSRIAHLGGLALHPEFRGRHLAEAAAREFQRHLLLDLGYHRLQLEIYGFNERGMRHAERSGFVREGVKRRAYRRHGEWVDGVTYALLREDLGLPARVDALYEYIARHNEGVRSGDWEPLGECLAEDATLEFEGVPVGPFRGRDAIVAAYRAQPPDDEVRIVEAVDGDPVVADYVWSRESGEPGGTLRATFVGASIAALVVSVARRSVT